MLISSSVFHLPACDLFRVFFVVTRPSLQGVQAGGWAGTALLRGHQVGIRPICVRVEFEFTLEKERRTKSEVEDVGTAVRLSVRMETATAMA